MDLITLGLAKKYTDEKVASGGGSNASVQVDTTLSKQGAAADAKAVGDALAKKQPKDDYVKTVNGAKPDANGNVKVETATKVSQLDNDSDYAPRSELPKTFCVVITANGDGSASADKTYQEITTAISQGRFVYCLWDGLILPFMIDDGSSLGFIITVPTEGAFVVYYVTIANDDTVDIQYEETSAMPNPNALTVNGVSYDGTAAVAVDTREYIVTVTGNSTDGYASDETMADIQAAEEAGRTIYCMMETDAQQWIYLPKVKEQDGARYFSAVCDGVEWLVTITRDGEDNTVVDVTQRELGATAFWVTVTQDGVGLAVDKSFAEIFDAHGDGQSVFCSLPDGAVLSLAAIDEEGALFQGEINREYQRVQIMADDTITYNSGKYALLEEIPSEEDVSPTDEQVKEAVDAYLDAHPEATTTIQDGSVTPEKTTWLEKNWHNIFDPDSVSPGYFVDDNTLETNENSDYYNTGLFPVKPGEKYVISAARLIKWIDSSGGLVDTIRPADVGYSRLYEIPDGVYYFRFDADANTLENMVVYKYTGKAHAKDTYKNNYELSYTDEAAEAITGAVKRISFEKVGGMTVWRWNIDDLDNAQTGGLNSSTGQFNPTVNDGTENIIRSVSPFEKVSESDLLYTTGDVYCYDLDKNYLGIASHENGVVTLLQGTAFVRTGNAYYADTPPTRGAYRRGYGLNDLNYATSNTDVPYSDCFPMFNSNNSLIGFKSYIGVLPFASKNFCFIGDSFTEARGWCEAMVDIVRCTLERNVARSGGRWSYNADAVGISAYEQAQTLVSEARSPDVILVTMGCNDAANGVTLGEIVLGNDISAFDTATYTGGMQACLNYLQNNFPDAIIFVGWTPAGGNCNWSTPDVVSPYIERMKEVCLIYGVEYIETRTCGITKYSDAFADYWEGGINGGHPLSKGHARIGQYMARLINSKA